MGWGEKESPAVNSKNFTKRHSPTIREPILKSDSLVARQSKSDISHLICIHNLAKAEEVLEHIDLSTFLCFTCVWEEHFMLCY